MHKAGLATGRGVACVAYEGDNGYTGIVTEVEVDQDTGKIVVKRVFVAIDAGPISNPDGLKKSSRRWGAPGHEPRAAGRGDVGRPEGNVD